MPKRPPANDRVPITDEWGIYDPAKAGMQALFARLGRPVLRASAKSARQERRRAFRPERTADGVGLAIEEAMIRAGVMEAKAKIKTEIAVAPAVRMSVARAVRLAAAAATPTAAGPFIPASVAPSAAGKKKATRRAKASAAAPVAAPRADADAPAVARAAGGAAVRTRAARKPAAPRIRTKAAVAAPVDIPLDPPAPVVAAPPAPSPRRPRGPVPLAAWARAGTDAARAEPRRGEKRGFWKGIFRMPSEVALVEYARGCRIHRLLIDTSDDGAMPDPL